MLNPGEPYGYEKEPEQGKVFPADKAVELDIIMEQGLEEAQGEQEEVQGDQEEEAQEELKSFQLEAQHIASRLLELKILVIWFLTNLWLRGRIMAIGQCVGGIWLFCSGLPLPRQRFCRKHFS